MTGRLPPIHAIGKSFSVDLDEPPDLSSEDSFTRDEEPQQRPVTYYFELAHADACEEALHRTFAEINPGAHTCKRQTSESSSGFIHCQHSVQVGQQYARLKKMLQTRAVLQLQQDYTMRINTLTTFVQDLEYLAQQEYATWDAISHNCLQETPSTKLEYLSAICEDLRTHMNHWNSVKQMVHTNKWLKPMVPKLSYELNYVQQQLYQLRDLAVWWTDRLIRLGLQVLAHCDLDRFTKDSIWAITRGLEDYNVTVSAVRIESQLHEISIPVSPGNDTNSKIVSQPYHNLDHFNAYHNLNENIKAISFGRVLSILASERSKYAAAMTHRFYTTSDDFLQLIHSGRLPEFCWDDAVKDTGQLVGHGTDTSDYVSASGSHISLSAAMLRIGDVLAPDLSQEMSPVIEFAQREQEFVAKFLRIVCDSTKMLKRPVPVVTSGRKGRPPSGPSNVGKKVQMSSVCSDTDSIMSSLSDPKRKSVSWGDAVDSSVVQQLSVKYMDMLWQSFGTYLPEFFTEHVWGDPDDAQKLLGHMAMCSTLTVMMIVKMVQQTCVKDLFPAGAVQSLQHLANRLQSSVAWTDWDQGMCRALASAVSDKCQMVPLVQDAYSTRTGKMTQDVFQPVVSVVASFNKQYENAQTTGSMSSQNTTMAMMLPTMQCLLSTCQFAYKWCNTKANQHLAGWLVGPFLLVTHSDLKLLADEMTRCLILSKSLCSKTSLSRAKDQEIQCQLGHLWHQINSIHGSMQTLSGAAVKMFSSQCIQMAKEYFAEAMPLNKFWRKKTTGEIPKEPSAYAESVTGTLLEPVVSGVSKLKPASQIGAISIAVTAVCDAWTSHILQEKIRFSLHGAYQLQLDFNNMLTWLRMSINNKEVKQSVVSLDVFKSLVGIVELLKQQPRGRLQRRPRNAGRQEESSMCCDIGLRNNNDRRYSLDTETTPASGSELDSSNDVSGGTISIEGNPDVTGYKVPNMEQWLALRLHGGNRNWKIPSCFNPTDIEI